MFERIVMDFYRKAGREALPWRREGISAYEVWVSEVMLQQTQVSRVIDYYERFLKRFPTVGDLAKASWEDFLPYYAGLGYYRRGRNMLLTAQKVMTEYGGELPCDKQLLMTLPGVGDYTASAILSFAYGENYLAWDTNLKRVVGRFFFGNKDFEEFDVSFHTHAKELNAALMDFGSAICLGRPKCKTCPLSHYCVYFAEEGSQEQETKNKKQKTKNKILRQAQNDTTEVSSTIRRDWREAQAYVWLHKDHKVYYSSHPKRFEVFVLPSEYNSRAGIKAYFKERYGLDLAVRPPHEKTLISDKTTLFVNAQILLGEPRFTVFSKEDVKAYNKSIEIIR